jgi:hypothetical protein
MSAAYISEDGPQFVTLTADGSNSRYARANSINALRRQLEAKRGYQLDRIHTAHCETYGFLSRTKCRYRVTPPTGEQES